MRACVLTARCPACARSTEAVCPAPQAGLGAAAQASAVRACPTLHGFSLQHMRREHLAHLPVVGGRVANDHAPAAASNGHSPAHLSICGCFRPARRGPILVAVLMRVATVVVRVVAECASKQQCKHYELMSNVLELCFHGLPAYVHLYISQHVFQCSSLLGCLLIPSY